MNRKHGFSGYICTIFIGLLVGFLITVISDQPVAGGLLYDSTTLPWSYQYNNTVAEAEWQKADQHWGVLPGRERSSSLWLRTTLPVNLPEGSVLVLHRPVLDVDVWMDGQPVLSSNGEARDYRPVGTAHYLVPVQSGAEVIIHLTSILPFLGLPEPVQLTDWGGHFGALIRSEMDEVFVTIALLLVIVSSLVLASFGAKQFLTWRLVAAALVALLYTLSQIILKDIALPATFFWFCLWLASLFALPAAFVGLLEAVIQPLWLGRFRQVIFGFGLVGEALLAAYLLLLQYSWADRVFLAMFNYRFFFQLVVVVTGIVSLIAVFQSEYRLSRRETRIMGFGLAVFFGSCLAQVQVALGTGANGARGNIHLGFLAFLLTGFAVQILRLLDQRRGYSRALGTLDTYKAALRYSLVQPLLVVTADGAVFYRNEVFLKDFGEARPFLPSGGMLVDTARDNVLVSLRLNIADGACRNVEALQIQLHDKTGCIAYIVQKTDPYAADHWDALSAREQDVARCVVQGLSNPEIADRLAISVRTVKAHCTSIFDKLDISSRKELMAGLLVHQAAQASGACAAGADRASVPGPGRVLLRQPRD
ncbi:MAG: LuxR C-terminal-related transcriptional regulator [Spirochaetes bacterium]|nr:LuxR C-terminal-related transcriptional regulator [Spirochaetota bacterium]